MMSEKGTPQLRFEGFTDPWEQRKLGEVTDSLQYGVGAAAFPYDGDIKYLRITDIDDDTHEFNHDELSSPDPAYELFEENFLSYGDMVFARTGASVGKTYLNREKERDTVFAGFLIRAKFRNGVSPEFVYQQTLRGAYGKFVEITSQRSGQPGINANEYSEWSFAWCSSGEQAKIGALLRKLDDLITLHQRKCEKLKNFKAAMLDKMFPKNGSDVPEVRFEGFTDPWEQRKLLDVVDIHSGCDYKHLEPGNVPVYGTGGLMTYVNQALSETENAVGIGRKGTIDQPCKLFAPFWTVDTLFYGIPNGSTNLDFLFCAFSNVDWKAKNESTGLPSLSKQTINETEVVVPGEGEQSRLGAFFSKLGDLITLHQRELEKLKNMKQSLLNQMFV